MLVLRQMKATTVKTTCGPIILIMCYVVLCAQIVLHVLVPCTLTCIFDIGIAQYIMMKYKKSFMPFDPRLHSCLNSASYVVLV